MTRGVSTAVDPRADAFLANRSAMLDLLAAVDEAQEAVLAGGGERYVARHRERGRLLVRERIDLLLDPGRRSWSCRRWPAGAPTTRSGAGSSPGWAWSRASSA